MDDDGNNVETIGHLNLGCALHPVMLTDGRIMFSSLETQGLRGTLHWGDLEHPPRRHQLGTVRQRLCTGSLAPSFHFQTQLSDGRVVVEMYYNLNQAGFGTYVQAASGRRRRGSRRSVPADPARSPQSAVAHAHGRHQGIPASLSAPTAWTC